MLSIRKQGFAPRDQSHNQSHEKSAVSNKDDGGDAVWNRSNKLDAAHWFDTNLYLDHIASAIRRSTI